jgi:hypothetical protein
LSLAAALTLWGCSKPSNPAPPTTPSSTPKVAYTPKPDPNLIAASAEFSQFRKSFYPVWVRFKKAVEEGAGITEFEELQRQFDALQVNLKDPVKNAAAKEFVKDCGTRCLTSKAERVLYVTEFTTGDSSKAQRDDAFNKSRALEFVTKGEERWKQLEAGQLIPASELTELKVGQKIYQADGGYVGMVKESRVEKGEMHWVVSVPDDTESSKPFSQWQSQGVFVVNQ